MMMMMRREFEPQSCFEAVELCCSEKLNIMIQYRKDCSCRQSVDDPEWIRASEEKPRKLRDRGDRYMPAGAAVLDARRPDRLLQRRHTQRAVQLGLQRIGLKALV